MIYRVLGFIFCEFLAVIRDQLIIDSWGWHIHVLIAFCLFQSVFFVICLQIIHGQVIYRNICLFADTYFFASIIICRKQLLFPVLHHKEAALSFLYSKNFPLYSKWIWNTAGNLVYSTVYFVNFWQSCFAIGIAGYQVDFSGLHEICHTVYVDVPVWPFKAGHSFVDPDFQGPATAHALRLCCMFSDQKSCKSDIICGKGGDFDDTGWNDCCYQLMHYGF